MHASDSKTPANGIAHQTANWAPSKCVAIVCYQRSADCVAGPCAAILPRCSGNLSQRVAKMNWATMLMRARTPGGFSFIEYASAAVEKDGGIVGGPSFFVPTSIGSQLSGRVSNM
jgi:hypothetical protein